LPHQSELARLQLFRIWQVDFLVGKLMMNRCMQVIVSIVMLSVASHIFKFLMTRDEFKFTDCSRIYNVYHSNIMQMIMKIACLFDECSRVD